MLTPLCRVLGAPTVNHGMPIRLRMQRGRMRATPPAGWSGLIQRERESKPKVPPIGWWESREWIPPPDWGLR
jgi:hypothetical protein